MLTKLLKVCGLPTREKHTAGINLKGEYLKDYGFNIGDYVNVEVTENKIVITKDQGTKVVSLFSKKNSSFDNLISTFQLTISKNG